MPDKEKTIENLLKAANDASGQARNMWLGFLGLLTYLLVTIAGTTHVDLLLNNPVKLPIVDVNIPLFSFFIYAPVLLLIFHLGLLIQHAMLGHKLHRLNNKLKDGRFTELTVHDCRSLLHSYVFSQMLAGQKPPRLLHMLMRLMVFVTLSLLPVLVLLYFQIKFLPYHDVGVTHAHRIAILLDLTLLFIVRPFFAMPYLRPRGRKLGFGNLNWRWELSWWSLGIAGSLCLAVMAFSLAVATVPQACFWPFGERTEEQKKICFSLDRAMALWWPIQVGSEKWPRDVFAPTLWLFEGTPNLAIGKPNSWFARNLIILRNNVIEGAEEDKVDTRLDLRDRDLKYADFSGSDLHGADFSFAKLNNSRMTGTRLFDAEFAEAEMQGVDLSGARLKEANLYRAEMQGANLEGARMQGADLFGARMQGANLEGARMQGAYLKRAQMQGAYLGGARMQGANLEGARMQGANLFEAKMQGANLRWAEMQGANLKRAQMQGANLKRAQMQGANLEGARMQGANLALAEMQGANLKGTRIWQVKPLEKTQIEAADLRAIAPTPHDPQALRKMLAGLEDKAVRKRVEKRLARLLDLDEFAAWTGSPERQAWTDFSSLSRPDPAAVTKILSSLACGDDTGGYIIKRIAWRISGPLERVEWHAGFTAAKLINKEICPAAKHLSEWMLAELRKIAGSDPEKPEPKAEK